MARWRLAMALGASVLAPEACSRSARQPTPGTLPSADPVQVASAEPPAAPPPKPPDPPRPHCEAPGSVLLFVSPEHPTRGKPVRVVAVVDHLIDAHLTLSAKGRDPLTVSEHEGGPPYHWVAQLEAPPAGVWRASFARDEACGGAEISARDVTVTTWRVPPAPPSANGDLWPVRASWSASLENLYSAWIERLFDAPLDEQPSFSALHEVLRDRSHNFLFDHLGGAEDEQGIVIRPDCADLPYFLRAYFAFKLGLPFGWSHCSRGEGGTPPICADFATNVDPFPLVDGKPQYLPPWADPNRARDSHDTAAKLFGEFLRTTLADAAQSGAGRTPAKDETGDYYPVALSVETLRPGTIFADPYGHVLVLAKRVAQTPQSGGILLAVDGQPDGTVARKRFWEGNFLFAIDPALGSAGFKRFRPIVRDKAGGWRRLGNGELRDYSLEQYSSGVQGFYDKVEDVLSPLPLDPTEALLETIRALEEQVKTRVNSVDNGRKFLASGKPPADMPDGAKIFETTGAWEDFSTPSRDLRLLIAVDVARALPARVKRRPERYAIAAGKDPDALRRELEDRLGHELDVRTFQYTRSDGSSWTLRLRDVVDRQMPLEMAYDPNDCVEHRWGAPAGSQEASTCEAHAPQAQVAKMEGYRVWFHERRRPPR